MNLYSFSSGAEFETLFYSGKEDVFGRLSPNCAGVEFDGGTDE